MAWTRHVALILITAGLLAGCGAGHELPAISEADSAIALQEIGKAPGLRSTSRTTQQNEQIARRVVQRLQAGPVQHVLEEDR